MLWLALGILLWSGLHLIPSLAPQWRDQQQQRFGATPYKIGFALGIVLSIVLMVVGWRSSAPTFLYATPSWLGMLALLAIIAAFILFGAGRRPTRIGHWVRHPQLTGVAVWAVSHLILNGDSRAVLLFGGLAIWSVAEIVLISRREGEWIKPEVPSVAVEIRGLVISLVVFAVVLLLHPWIAGVAPVVH